MATPEEVETGHVATATIWSLSSSECCASWFVHRKLQYSSTTVRIVQQHTSEQTTCSSCVLLVVASVFVWAQRSLLFCWIPVKRAGQQWYWSSSTSKGLPGTRVENICACIRADTVEALRSSSLPLGPIKNACRACTTLQQRPSASLSRVVLGTTVLCISTGRPGTLYEHWLQARTGRV